MARTATKAAPVEPVEPVEIEDIAAASGDQNGVIQIRDNWPVVITLAATNSPDQLPPGSMTAQQASAYIKGFQDRGFDILSSNAIQAGDVNGIYTLQVFYCLVKGQ